jgi:two-component system phosphate regulon sensor histidine kinase PhoR
MISRLFNFLVLLLLGFLLGFLLPHGLGGWQGACMGIVIVAVLFFGLDTWRSLFFLRWLQSGDILHPPDQSGIWGESADRVRRVFRQKDIEFKASEESLRQFLSAIQASPNGVVLLDTEWHIVWSNRTASQHLGIDPERDIKQLIGYLLRDPAFSAYVRSSRYEHEILIEGRENRSEHPQKIAVQVFPYGDGRKLLLSRDITALEQAEAMRKDFVANVSHEIRTPLTVLVGFVETMQNLNLSPDEIQNYLQLMSHQALRMQTLVQDLLTLSHLEGSPLPSDTEWHSFDKLWLSCHEEALGLLKSINQKNESTHDLNFELAQELKDHEISGSLAELKSAFSNLVSNALRYTPSGGCIHVSWTRKDNSYEFSVVDSGAGIAIDHLPRLTERFYRVDRSRSRDTGGTGLGLAIVKHVMQRHGGQLRIESKLNVGSTFTLVFPVSRLRRKLPEFSSE